MTNAPKCSFQVDSRDNVATLLSDAEPRAIRITGEGQHDTVVLLEPIQRGYKVAITDLDGIYERKEAQAPYSHVFSTKKVNLNHDNIHLWEQYVGNKDT